MNGKKINNIEDIEVQEFVDKVKELTKIEKKMITHFRNETICNMISESEFNSFPIRLQETLKEREINTKSELFCCILVFFCYPSDIEIIKFITDYYYNSINKNCNFCKKLKKK